jgi:archaeal chaperonin
VAEAVESTLGPKGLDTMLVDQGGGIVVTNAGFTILDRMEVAHPAARMLINIARAQHEEVGDGTTTAAILAAALINEGLSHILRGVPVSKLLEGIRFGIRTALQALEQQSRAIKALDDPCLLQTTTIAARGRTELAALLIQAAQYIGMEVLKQPAWRLADIIIAKAAAQDEVFSGLIIDKRRLNRHMPKDLTGVSVLVLDDALEPEALEAEALSTEAGFARFLALQEEFKLQLHKLSELRVNFIAIGKGVSDLAEEFLLDAGITAASRLTGRDMRRLAEHTGARPLKRVALKRGVPELQAFIGSAKRIYEDEKLGQLRVIAGAGISSATCLVGASTPEVASEKERIAKDAAAALQSAVKGGVVPGGGAVELALSRVVDQTRNKLAGMSIYGLDCVVQALKKPMFQIVQNAGFNPLEKVEEALSRQDSSNNSSLGIDCENGSLIDMWEHGVLDPTLVKHHVLNAAGEVAEAILRIKTIIKMQPARLS